MHILLFPHYHNVFSSSPIHFSTVSVNKQYSIVCAFTTGLRSLYLNFPARAPTDAALIANMAYVSVGKGRSAAGQAGIQAAALGITLAISIVGGLATGME